MRKISTSRKVFLVVNTVFCLFVGLVCLMPVVHVLAMSFSSKTPVESGNVLFWPVDFVMDNYILVAQDAQFYQSYLVSFIRVIVGWFIQIMLTVLAAYPMARSRRQFPARRYYVLFFMITMFFNGGMIPTYLVVSELGLIDTFWALVLPGCVSVYNIILIMNFMKGLPDAISEAAYIDGAGHTRTLWSVILPLCKPSIATVSLFIVLGLWNDWFGGMLYIRSQALKPLQTYLRSIVVVTNAVENMTVEDMLGQYSTDGAAAAKIFLAMIPIFCFYPFVQKYFVKGLVYGSVKE